MNYSKRNDIYLFDHLPPALIKFSGVRVDHAHIQPDIQN